MKHKVAEELPLEQSSDEQWPGGERTRKAGHGWKAGKGLWTPEHGLVGVRA
jgi:hypothetical protein